MQIDISSETVSDKLSNNPYYPLYSQLKPYVESYGGGLAALAQKVSISKPTLWRWVNFKNTKSPNPYHVLSLVKFVTKKDSIVEVASHVGGEIELYLKKSFPGDFEAMPVDYALNIDEIFEDFYCYFIYLLCDTSKEMTRKSIKTIIGTYSLESMNLSIEDNNLCPDLLENLGVIAEVKINKLIDNNVLKELDGRLINLVPSTRVKVSHTKRYLPKLFTFFKEKNMHKKTNIMYAYQESVPQETIKKIIDLQYETFMKCYKLMERDKTPDGEVYLLTTFVENFGFE